MFKEISKTTEKRNNNRRNGCVNYRRRNTTHYVEKETIKLDNRFVVPYNIRLCLKFRAHINVKVCSQSMLIKYLFKYLTNGPDRIRAVIENNICMEKSRELNYTEIRPFNGYLYI